MSTRDTLLFSLSLPLFLSLSLSLSASPTGYTINCLLHPFLISFHCSIPPSLFLLPQSDRCGEVHDMEGRDGLRVCVLSVCLCRWVWVQKPMFLALTSTSHPWPPLPVSIETHTYLHTP